MPKILRISSTVYTRFSYVVRGGEVMLPQLFYFCTLIYLRDVYIRLVSRCSLLYSQASLLGYIVLHHGSNVKRTKSAFQTDSHT